MKINFFDIGWFSRKDGPGLRTVLYLQGCNLRCPWCHSPHSRESVSPLLFNPVRCQNCGRCAEVCKQDVHHIVNGTHTVLRDKCIKCGCCVDTCPVSARSSNTGALVLATEDMEVMEIFENYLRPQLEATGRSGGITISGGEALLQKEAVRELLKLCKITGHHTAIETSLCVPLENLKYVSRFVDCWLIGMRSLYLPGSTPQMDTMLRQNIAYLSELDSEVIVRYPAIKGYTQSEEQMSRVAEYMRLGNFNHIEIIPCNSNMSHYYSLSGIAPEINVEEVYMNETEINSIYSFFNSQFYTDLVD